MSLTSPVNAQRNKGNTEEWQKIQSKNAINAVLEQKATTKRDSQIQSNIPGSDESSEYKNQWNSVKREKRNTTNLIKKNNSRAIDTNMEDIYEQIVRTSKVKVVKISKMSLQDVVGLLMKKPSNHNCN